MEVSNVKCVLLDIEGTICGISFVKDTLFPYALQALPEVLQAKWDDPDFAYYRNQFPGNVRQSPETLQAHIEDLTARDVKQAPLKNLQGYLWKTGYETGAFATPLFADVLPQLRHWRDKGVMIAIYSSGSVFAQQLLFQYVKDPEGNAVDMRSMISRYFDTENAGPKILDQSYAVIANAIDIRPENILFVSDNVNELVAAEAVRMKAVLAIREGNAPIPEESTCFCVKSLEDIRLR
ncbi:MAG: enolase-phosphatase E1 [Bogoriella megaspora]|nr:MAG: enolase-phosphatase E1 [Bogoriella megaspora]